MSKLGSTLCLEVSGDQAAPIVLAGSPLPAGWKHSFSTTHAEQAFLDIHLLHGASYKASENVSLGRWRVSRLPPSEEERLEVDLQVRVDIQGAVTVTAYLAGRPLNVFLLPGSSTQVPIEGDEPGPRSGEIVAGAESVQKEAALEDAPQVAFQEETATGDSHGGDTQLLQCGACGGKQEVRFVGDLSDKRLVCRYCDTELDIPDAYQRVTRKREHEEKPWGSRTTESVLIETRSDYPTSGEPLRVAPELDENPPEIQNEGVEATGEKYSQESELSLSIEEKASLASVIRNLDQSNPRGREENGYRPLSPEEIINLAGEPLPEEERCECPNCGAIISRQASVCEWCSVFLADFQEGD